MSIRCRYERDGQGIVLSKIESPADALKIRNFFAEKSLGALVIEPVGPKDYRIIVEGAPFHSFVELVISSNIELID